MPTALMNATYLTALRTAAGSAVGERLFFLWNGKEWSFSNHFILAFDFLADSEEKSLVVFGAGLQAELHIYCFCSVR